MRLDAAPSPDAGLTTYPLALDGATRRRRAWLPGIALTQSEGGSAAFAWTAEALASPCRVTCSTERHGNALARGVASFALSHHGHATAAGLSVDAAGAALRARGYLDEFRWADGIDQIIDAVVTYGPVVVAGVWREAMSVPRPSGLLEVHGAVVGRHAWLVHGYHPAMRIHGEGWGARHEVLRIRNSAGPRWGIGGSALIAVEDMAPLVREGAVAVHHRHHGAP